MSKNKKRPNWWPENPYPEEIFPMTIKDYVREIKDPDKRTAISGCLGRLFWGIAEETIYDTLIKEGILEE